MALAALDQERLQEALALGRGSFGLTEPNPRVGCVIGHSDGRVLGRGATQQAGGPHAEVMALRELQSAGHSAAGATVWVTLEPCAHHGRTPPCCDALVAAGVARVVIATDDPFSAVAGRGTARLRAAGIEVLQAGGEFARAAQEDNIGFFSRVLRGRPWVRVKLAASLDGHTALSNGQSQWITGPAARADGHAWRRRAGAVMAGSGTVLADQPRLDVRLVPTPGQPLRIVLDSTLRVPADARVYAPPGPVMVATTSADRDRIAVLQARGVEVLPCPAGLERRVDLAALLVTLAGRGVNELHVEAGAALAGALVGAGLADELLVYVAPLLLGEGRGLAALPAVEDLADVPRGRFFDCNRVGDDLRIRMRLGSEDSWLRGADVQGGVDDSDNRPDRVRNASCLEPAFVPDLKDLR